MNKQYEAPEYSEVTIKVKAGDKIYFLTEDELKEKMVGFAEWIEANCYGTLHIQGRLAGLRKDEWLFAGDSEDYREWQKCSTSELWNLYNKEAEVRSTD